MSRAALGGLVATFIPLAGVPLVVSWAVVPGAAGIGAPLLVALPWFAAAAVVLLLDGAGRLVSHAQAAARNRSGSEAAWATGRQARIGTVAGAVAAGSVVLGTAVAVSGPGWRAVTPVATTAAVLGVAWWHGRRAARIPAVDEETAAWGRRVRRLFRVATEPAHADQLAAARMRRYVCDSHELGSRLVVRQRRRWAVAELTTAGYAAIVQLGAVGALWLGVADHRAVVVAVVWLLVATRSRERLSATGRLV